MNEALTVVTAANLGSRHAFLGRTGGVSGGLFHSLNSGLGSSDDRAAILANRATAAGALGVAAEHLVTVHQVHGVTAVTAARWPLDSRPPADAIATREPGLALGILTADCAPILFEDRANGVVAAAHAGWKGALGGIIEATVCAMEQLGASRRHIAAAVGPCIGAASYEVDDGFAARFVAADSANQRFFQPGRPGHRHFALEAYCLHRLHRAGISNTHGVGADTCAEEARFFSYRRATLAHEADYGRQISLIRL